MRTFTRMPRLALLALPLALSACGGEDGNDDGPGTTPLPLTDVRFLHFLDVTSNPIDIYLQSDLLDTESAPSPLLSNVAPDAFSETIQLEARTTSFAITNTGQDPLVAANIIAAATGAILREDEQNLILLFTDPATAQPTSRTLREDLMAPATGARYRFVHISENFTGSIQLFDANDNVNPAPVGSSITVGSAQDIDLPVAGDGRYILGLASASSATPRVEFPLTLTNGDAFTAFIRGAGTDMEQLVLIGAGDARSTIDSRPFMEPGSGQINVVNLADDSGELTLTAEGPETQTLSVPFGNGSTPRPILEGSYDITVQDAANNDVVTLEGFEVEPGDFFTLVLYDDPSGDVILEPLQEDDSMPPVGQSRLRIIHIAPDVTDPIDLLDATGPTPLTGYQGVTFGDVGPAFNLTGSIELGIDADDRDDLEFTFAAPTIDAGRVVNLFIDSQEALGELTLRLVAQPITGSTQPAITGSVVPDPSFVRGINLALLLQPPGQVDFFESSNLNTPAQASIAFGASGMGYVQVDADSSAQVLFTPPGEQGTVIAQGPASFGVDDSHTAAIYGTAGSYETSVYVDELDPPPGPGEVRLRLINSAVGVGSISGTFEGSNLGSNLGFGDAGPYVTVVPGADPELTLQTGQTFTLTLSSVTGGRVYNVFFVNDPQNGQQFVVVQDDIGNTESTFRPADVRVLNLISDPMNEEVAVASLGGTAIGTNIPQNTVSQVTEVQEGSFPALCGLNSGFTVQGQISAVFGDLTTVVCQGFSQATGGVFSAVEKPVSTAGTGEIEWRFANFATNFPQSGLAVNVLDPTDPMNPFALGVTANQVPPTFLTGDAAGFPIIVEINPGTPQSEEVFFEVPALPDQTAYTFYISRAPNPMTLGPVQLVIVSSDPSATPVAVGANGDVTTFHASPNVAPLDIFADQDPTPIVTNLGFGEASDSVAVEGGETRIDAALTGNTIMDSVFDFTGTVTGRSDNTVVLFGETTVQGAIFNNPGVGGGGPSTVNVRILHTSSELGQVDLYDVATGQLINGMTMGPWEDLLPGQATSYAAVDSNLPITVGVDVESTNSGLPGASSPAYDYFVDLNLGALGVQSGTANLVLVHDVANNDLSFRLQLTEPSGSPVLPFGPTSRIRLVNASGPDASIDLFINGFVGPTGSVDLGEASDWEAIIPAAGQTLDIVPAGQTPGVGVTLASLSNVILDSGRSYTVVYNRAGGGANILLLDDNYAGLGTTETTVRFVHAGPGFGQVDVYDVSTVPPTLLAENLDEGVASGTVQLDPTSLPPTVPIGVDQDDDPTTVVGAAIDNGVFSPGNFLHVILFTNASSLPQGLVLLSDGFQDTESVQ
ncbi:MAG: DUF4397 domain-containing protein [Myxococcota bacterium]